MCTTESLKRSVSAGETERDQGVSLLEAKTQLLLDYNIHLTFLMLLKSEGKTIVGHPVLGAF